MTRRATFKPIAAAGSKHTEHSMGLVCGDMKAWEGEGGLSMPGSSSSSTFLGHTLDP